MKKRNLISLFLTVVLVSCNDSSITSSINPTSWTQNENLVLTNTTEFKEAHSLSSIGNQKILVIPCEFSGEREFTSNDLELIENAFFNENLSTEDGRNSYSLTEFYKQSSLDKLNITGEVTDVLKIPYTVDFLTDDGSYFPGVAAECYYKLSSVTDDYLKSYDQDSDGYVDSVVFVYSSPTSERTGSFWAWVANFDTEKSISRPNFSRHMWVGLDFFAQYDYDIDAHTIIHETGHLLGLRDYYPSDNYNLALGGHSMMDYNISDHDPYSKYLLGWAEPIYYDFENYQEVTIKLEPFQGTNKFVLFNPNWNYSAMDEYLMFEYYTPTLLNSLDAKYQYGTRPLGFTESGIKIYHVDSRIAKCEYSQQLASLVFNEYVNEIPSEYDENTYYVIAASNNTEDSHTDASRQGRYKQIALIENKEFNTLQSGATADNDSLFQVGDVFSSFDSAYISNGKFNNGNEINLTMTVNEMTDEYATITLKYQGGTNEN